MSVKRPLKTSTWISMNNLLFKNWQTLPFIAIYVCASMLHANPVCRPHVLHRATCSDPPVYDSQLNSPLHHVLFLLLSQRKKWHNSLLVQDLFFYYHAAFHTSKIRGQYPKRQVGVCLRYLHIKQGKRQQREPAAVGAPVWNLDIKVSWVAGGRPFREWAGSDGQEVWEKQEGTESVATGRHRQIRSRSRRWLQSNVHSC